MTAALERLVGRQVAQLDSTGISLKPERQGALERAARDLLPSDIALRALQDGEVAPDFELPVPATYAVAPGGRILYVSVDPDGNRRPDPEGILVRLRACRPSGPDAGAP